jgi:hypothetical protein
MSQMAIFNRSDLHIGRELTATRWGPDKRAKEA